MRRFTSQLCIVSVAVFHWFPWQPTGNREDAVHLHLRSLQAKNMSRAQAESVIKNIIREIAQECAGKGHAVSETLVAFMVGTWFTN